MGMDLELEKDLVIKSTPHVTIERREYDLLRLAAAKLDMLEAHGVDNWTGYCDAMQELHDSEEYGTQPSAPADEPTFQCGKCGCPGEFYNPSDTCGNCDDTALNAAFGWRRVFARLDGRMLPNVRR